MAYGVAVRGLQELAGLAARLGGADVPHLVLREQQPQRDPRKANCKTCVDAVGGGGAAE